MGLGGGIHSWGVVKALWICKLEALSQKCREGGDVQCWDALERQYEKEWSP